MRKSSIAGGLVATIVSTLPVMAQNSSSCEVVGYNIYQGDISSMEVYVTPVCESGTILQSQSFPLTYVSQDGDGRYINEEKGIKVTSIDAQFIIIGNALVKTENNFLFQELGYEFPASVLENEVSVDYMQVVDNGLDSNKISNE